MIFLYKFGHFFLFLKEVFKIPENKGQFRIQLFNEINSLGIGSIGIITIISFFIGAVIVIQTAFNLDGSFIPAYTVGYAARQSIVLEFSPTMIALILTGKIGSNITSQIGTMRISEQIDALEIMGINSANYLVLPKIIGLVIINPFIITISMLIGIFGGLVAGVYTGLVTYPDYIYGLQYEFRQFDYAYAMIKTVAFAFVIPAISSYYGYYVKGGAVEIGKASTKAVVTTSIVVLILNYVITQFILI